MTDRPAIHLCLAQPPGVAMSSAATDAMAQYAHHLKRLGRRVSADINRLRHDAVNLIFGAQHGFDVSVAEHCAIVVVNSAATVPTGRPLPIAYEALLASQPYASDAPGPDEAPAAERRAAAVVAYGPLPPSDNASPLAARSIDILVLGAVNARQQAVLQHLEALAYRVVLAADSLPADQRDALVRNARAVLLLAPDDSSNGCWQRAAAALTLGTPVFCELATPAGLPSTLHGCIGAFPVNEASEYLATALAAKTFADAAQRQIERFRSLDVVDGYAAVLTLADAQWEARNAGPVAAAAQDLHLSWSAAHTVHVKVDGQALPQRLPSPLFQYLDEPAAQIESLLAAGKYHDAMQTVAAAVHHHYCLPDIKHRALYYPAFDALLQRMSTLVGDGPAAAAATLSDVTVIVATEVYQVGGHTRVIEDIAREAKAPVIVLTDLFGNYGAQEDKLAWIREKFRGVHVVCLPPGNLWDKALMLRRIVSKLSVANIVYLQHHQDPIPFVGTLTHAGSRKTFVHHGDHNPSLGCTLKGLQHADLSGHVQQTCAAHLGEPAALLPMHVADRGMRRAASAAGHRLSVATCGHPAKYSKTGGVALHHIATAVLTSVPGQLYHIGQLDDAWIAQIRGHLDSVGIEPGRFVAIGAVESLWDALLALDVGFYLGSAPVGGGRAAVEAQGAGLPLLFYRGEESGSLIQNYTLYAHQALGWTTLADLQSLLTEFAPAREQLGLQARLFYEQNFGAAPFRKALGELIGESALALAA